jgi:PDZ domain-containing protein
LVPVNVRGLVTPFRIAVVGVFVTALAVVLIITTTGAGLSAEFLLVPDPAHPLANLVSVPGSKPQDKRGGIYYVDVFERKASLFDRLFPPKGATVIRQRDLTPPGVSESQRLAADALDMRLSQQIATAVALRALGDKVRIQEYGVRVELVYGRTHAVGVLKPRDVIVRADGRPIHSILELHNIVARHKAGEAVSLTFLRNGRAHHVRIRTTLSTLTPRQVIIGFEPQPAIRLRIPFEIRFNLGDVGGPSAGLAFALQILEARGRDVDHGYKVAATGEIAPDGSVGPIGAIEQKTIGARQAHVDVFLVPAGDNYSEARKYANGLKIIPVQTFQQALQKLATLPPKR